MNLGAHVDACLDRYRLAHTTGIVAVSGGPDSVALAHLLVGLLQAGRIDRLLLAHVNHQLRGDESDADEAFVQSLPERWRQPNLICYAHRIDVAAIAQAERGNLEGTARRERYSWLTQLAHSQHAAWIATGHTADDQAETVLFRLLRGAGVLGLSGMAECRMVTVHPSSGTPGEGRGVRAEHSVADCTAFTSESSPGLPGEGGERLHRMHDERVALVRPLLKLGRLALLEYLQAGHIPYRLDTSNHDLRFTRNRLRLELLPRLEAEYNPAIVETLCRLADQAAELHADVSAQATQLLKAAELPRAGDIRVFSVERLRQVSKNLVRELFRLVWQRENWPMGDMDFERWNRLVEIVTGSRPASDFPGGIHVRRVGAVVQIHVKAAKSA